MIRYVNDRFIDVELVVSEKTGLKIPNSAITKKQFYTVPKEYFTQGGDSSDPGLMIETVYSVYGHVAEFNLRPVFSDTTSSTSMKRSFT